MVLPFPACTAPPGGARRRILPCRKARSMPSRDTNESAGRHAPVTVRGRGLAECAVVQGRLRTGSRSVRGRGSRPVGRRCGAPAPAEPQYVGEKFRRARVSLQRVFRFRRWTWGSSGCCRCSWLSSRPSRCSPGRPRCTADRARSMRRGVPAGVPVRPTLPAAAGAARRSPGAQGVLWHLHPPVLLGNAPISPSTNCCTCCRRWACGHCAWRRRRTLPAWGCGRMDRQQVIAVRLLRLRPYAVRPRSRAGRGAARVSSARWPARPLHAVRHDTDRGAGNGGGSAPG